MPRCPILTPLRLLLAALTLSGPFSSIARAEGFAWVQLGPDDKISVRAVVEDATCPALTADGAPLAMSVRADANTHIGNIRNKLPPDKNDFSKVIVCEASVPPATMRLLQGDQPLPLPPHEIRRIVMFGDTGCRLKIGKDYEELQDCNDKDAWPYAKVARHAADENPDLVIHVGDYAYRESACPSPRRDCAGNWGYGYDSWKADFFEPSRPLLARAPWIMVRGNHENCDRAGEGWFRFLDHGAVPKDCADLTGFFVIKRSDLGFVVMDNAAADETRPADVKGQTVELLRRQFRATVSDIPQQAWLLAHRPVNALRFDSAAGSRSDNDIEQNAIGRDLPSSVRMVVSGHIHIFEALSFEGRPPQLVVGTGGDNLEDLPPQKSIGVRINGAKVRQGLVLARFGYTVWDKDAAGWKARVFDDDRRQLASCTLERRNLACKGRTEAE